MDVLGWLWWLVSTLVGWVLSLVWLLVGGWVSTLLQILVVVGLILAWKYGWRRAPLEAWRRITTYWPRVRGWIGRRGSGNLSTPPKDVPANRSKTRAVARPRRKWTAVRLSQTLTALMLIGLCVLALVPAK